MTHFIAFLAGNHPTAQAALPEFTKRYANVAPDKASVIVALGGDGFILETLHRYMNSGIPIYGMNRGTVGFLMNRFDLENLEQRLAKAIPIRLRPLKMTTTTPKIKNRHGQRSRARVFQVKAVFIQVQRNLRQTSCR